LQVLPEGVKEDLKGGNLKMGRFQFSPKDREDENKLMPIVEWNSPDKFWRVVADDFETVLKNLK